ncbi:MAG: tRNA (cytidine(34)-2'-O)-methyltransferase [Alphaproteobacteria bacterium]|nr:MAG: tRNA (cytidine(34)-2'-O)-methyltransferase [Alphaproteobacteria bacterium]
MRLVLFQPDIPQNTGAILRLAACFGVAVDVIEPCGFVWDEPRMRRAGMDYLDAVEIRRHSSWGRYREAEASGRLVLLTTRADLAYGDFAFQADDRLLLGRETSGAPAELHDAADARIAVPMRPGLRSLNVAMAAAIVLAEALRRTGALPDWPAAPGQGPGRQPPGAPARTTDR